MVIGNEALPSRVAIAKKPKLVGMEVLRLALERARSANEAVDVITGLVETHGQGKFDNALGLPAYDNIYLCADPHEAYVVECVGHEWAVKQIQRFASISNIGMIGRDADRVSASASDVATREGLYEPEFGRGFSFADAFADRANSVSGAARQRRSFALLGRAAGRIDALTMMATLSDHSDGTDPDEPWVEDVRGPMSLCMHRRDSENPGATAASLVADLCADGSRLPVYWCALYSPCMSLFYPVFIEGDLPQSLSMGGQNKSLDSPWWLFYELTHAESERAAGASGQCARCVEATAARIDRFGLRDGAPWAELVADGSADEAAKLLTTYMTETVARMLDVARSLLRAVGSGR